MALTKEDLKDIRELLREEITDQVEPLRQSVANLEQRPYLTREDVSEIVRAEVPGIIQEMVPDIIQDMVPGIVRAEVTDQVEPLRRSVAKLEQLPHKVQLLAEGLQATNERLDRLQKTVDDMSATVTALDILHQMQERR